MRRQSGMLNLPWSPAHGPKFHTWRLNSLCPLITFFSFFYAPPPSLTHTQLPLISSLGCFHIDTHIVQNTSNNDPL